MAVTMPTCEQRQYGSTARTHKAARHGVDRRRRRPGQQLPPRRRANHRLTNRASCCFDRSARRDESADAHLRRRDGSYRWRRVQRHRQVRDNQYHGSAFYRTQPTACCREIFSGHEAEHTREFPLWFGGPIRKDAPSSGRPGRGPGLLGHNYAVNFPTGGSARAISQIRSQRQLIVVYDPLTTDQSAKGARFVNRSRQRIPANRVNRSASASRIHADADHRSSTRARIFERQPTKDEARSGRQARSPLQNTAR